MKLPVLLIEKLPLSLQEFLDSDMIILLCAICVILIIVIAIVTTKILYETKDINRMIARHSAERKKKSTSKREYKKKEKE